MCNRWPDRVKSAKTFPKRHLADKDVLGLYLDSSSSLCHHLEWTCGPSVYFGTSLRHRL